MWERSCLRQAPGFHDYIFTDNQPLPRHLFKFRQNSGYVFFLIHKEDEQRKLAAGIHKRAGFHSTSSDKSRHPMKDNRIGDVLLAEIVEDLQMRGLALIFVALIEVDRYLNGHGGNCK